MLMQERSVPCRAPRGRVFAVFVLLATMVCAAVFGTGVPAHAASPSYMVNFGGWLVGGFHSSNGDLVYCIEPGAYEPSGPQHSPVATESLPAFSAQQADITGWNAPVAGGEVSGDALRQMNWLLTTHGQTTDQDLAAAVQLAVWFLRDDPGVYDWLLHHVLWIQAHGGTWHLDRAYALADEARAIIAATPDVMPSTPLELTFGEEYATGTVSYPQGTSQLRITGGVFDGGESNVIVAPEAGSVGWRATMQDAEWKSERSIEISSEGQQEFLEWPAKLMLHAPVVASQQRLGAMVGPVQGYHGFELDPVGATFDTKFSPVLVTQAEEPFVASGSAGFADRVTFSVAEGSAPWATRMTASGDMEYAPVVAHGTLYGPFSEPPLPGDVPPQDAPVALQTEIHADRGPGEYRATADTADTAEFRESGYYSWVWRIDEDSQQPEIREAELLPDSYTFSDGFGLEAEGQIVPMRLQWSTELEEQLLPLDGLALKDTLQIAQRNGEWVRDSSGQFIPARIRLTVYVTETKPEQQASAPSNAREVARGFVEADGSGKAAAEAMSLPFETRGWVTVQSCLFAVDQPEQFQYFTEEWCDDFGVPEETAQISVPEVRTEAQADAVLGGQFQDVAFVTGLVPTGADLGFTYYLQPEAGAQKYDENWVPLSRDDGNPALWTEEELAGLTEDQRCLAQAVASTSRIPAVAGANASPFVEARSVGRGYWVEDLAMPHPETGDPVELHRGACGLEHEQTVIHPEQPVAPASAAPLARTGAPFDPRGVLWGGAALLGAAVLSCAVSLSRSRGARNDRSEEPIA